ncbi:L-rhamnose mutarotase [Sphingomonas faeni]|uniref:L-rhamnose mutarotase n=1 Tax=Sphingomonas faeni TaxID=185950 RepID=UPI002785B8D1|nr:L-rhamnose mutarotase [Sphingomonas faeni]MDQ0839877.1 L-rhamnose mutarotase [Sphingomonas faeni]
MKKIAFKMQLKPGHLQVYRQRHDEIWPELVQTLKAAGPRDYSIQHDAETDALFTTMWCTDDQAMEALHTRPVMRRWWESMASLLETNADGSPVSIALDTVFHLD